MKTKWLAAARGCLALAALALGGCGVATLTPAPAANEVTGARGEGALSTENGVMMVARADAWRGNPPGLTTQLTPLLVTVENRSGAPVRIGYNHFRLVSETGRRFSALPPFSIEQKVQVAGTPYYPSAGFGYAPYLSPYFGDATIYGGPFQVDSLYWDRFEPVMRSVELPTPDMVQKALPEGVLEPGGRVTGFLYFEGVGPDVERVRMLADFPNAATMKRVARLEIPFIVE